LAKRGDEAEARRRIESVEEAALQLPPESGIGKMMLLTQLAGTQIEVGDLKGAQQMIGQIKEEFPRSPIAAQLAAAFARAGDTAAALEMVALVGKDRRSRGTYLQPVVKELILANHLDAAKQVLADLGNSAEEAEAYRAAGRAMLETHRGRELYDWLPDMPSDVARAFACIGAAEGLKPPQPSGSQ
jgi:thioredoxin-like negative regulator of GroEL